MITTIPLGSTVKDSSTGIKGRAVAYTMWENGCERICIQPLGQKDGKPIDAHHCDIQYVSILTAAKLNQPKPTGGPKPAAIRGH